MSATFSSDTSSTFLGFRIAGSANLALAAASLLLASPVLLQAADAKKEADAKAAPSEVAATADTIVKSLYAAHQSEKGTPFFQYKDRAVVNRFFTKQLGDLIWKDAKEAKGEVGRVDFDPLFQTQDPKITRLSIGKPEATKTAGTMKVTASFKDWDKSRKVSFLVVSEDGKAWKVDNILYSDGLDMKSMLTPEPAPKK